MLLDWARSSALGWSFCEFSDSDTAVRVRPTGLRLLTVGRMPFCMGAEPNAQGPYQAEAIRPPLKSKMMAFGCRNKRKNRSAFASAWRYGSARRPSGIHGRGEWTVY
jgi:hypothetical protein